MRRYQKSIITVVIAFIVLYIFSGYFNGFRVKKGIQAMLNPYLTTDIEIGGAYINSFTGDGYLKDIRIPNPPGFVGKNAFYIEKIEIKGGPRSLHGEVITLDQLHVQNMEVMFLTSKAGNNFAKIFRRSRLGNRVYLKQMKLDQCKIDPIQVYLGPKVMNQNPYKFTLESIVVDQSDLKDSRMRTLGHFLASNIVDQVDTMHQAGTIPMPESVKPYVNFGVGEARLWLDIFQ